MVCIVRSKVLRHTPEFLIRLFVIWISTASLNTTAQENAPHSVSFGSVALPVTSIELIATDTLKITVFGEELLVTNQTAGRVVIDRYLKHFEAVPAGTVAIIPSIVTEAVERGDSSLIRKILTVAVERDQPIEFADILFWKRLLQSSLAREALGAVLAMRENPGLKKKCVIVRALHSYGEVVPRGVMPLDEEAVRCLRDIRQGLEEVFSGKTTLSEVRNSYSFDKTIFRESKDMPIVVDRYIGIIDILEKGLNDGNWEVFREGLQLGLVEGGPEVSTLWSKGAIFFIKQSMHNNSSIGVLRALPAVTEDFRTPTLHTDVVSAIGSLRVRDLPIFLDPDIAQVLQMLVIKDEEIRYELTLRLLGVTTEAKTREDLLLCNEVAQMFAENKLIAQSAKRDVALALAQKVLKIGTRGDARFVQDRWRGSLSIGTNLRLNLFQWGVWQLRWFFIVMSCGVGAWFWRRWSKHYSKANKSNGGDTVRSEAVNEPGDATISDELSASLAFFGLQPGATEKEIKNAYRTVVKRYHPDSGRVDHDGNDQFIKITGEYERLLKLLKKRTP